MDHKIIAVLLVKLEQGWGGMLMAKKPTVEIATRSKGAVQKTQIRTRKRTTFNLKASAVKKLMELTHKLSSEHERIWQGEIVELGINLIYEAYKSEGRDSPIIKRLNPVDVAPAIKEGIAKAKIDEEEDSQDVATTMDNLVSVESKTVDDDDI